MTKAVVTTIATAALTTVLIHHHHHHAAAFAPPLASRVITSSFSSRRQKTDNNFIYCPPLQAGPPIISNWRYESSKGVISGVVSNHPTISDGDRITTSPVKDDPSRINENLIIQTKTGSKYKLSNAAWGAPIPALEAQKKARQVKEQTEKEAAQARAQAAQASKMAQLQVVNAPSRQIPPAASAQQTPPVQLIKLAKSAFSLTASITTNN